MFEGMMTRASGAFVVRMIRHSEGGASVCPADNSASTTTSCTTSFVTSLVL
jgi:hypothetical protein